MGERGRERGIGGVGQGGMQSARTHDGTYTAREVALQCWCWLDGGSIALKA